MHDLVVEMLAASAGGCTATLLGHPLDCIKVRLQAEQSGLSTTARAARMLREEGAAVFLRGVAPPLANAAVMNTAMFVAFAECRRRMPDTALGAFASGAVAGVATATLSTPFDYLKIQAQLRGTSALAVLGATVRAPGKLFRGHGMNCCREGVFTAVYLGCYDLLRVAITGESAPEARLPLPMAAAVSATTGALAWVANYPFDTVKSLQQAVPPGEAMANRTSALAAAKLLWRSGGVAAFYKGLAPSTARAVLVTCSRLVAYEWVRATLGPGGGA